MRTSSAIAISDEETGGDAEGMPMRVVTPPAGPITNNSDSSHVPSTHAMHTSGNNSDSGHTHSSVYAAANNGNGNSGIRYSYAAHNRDMEIHHANVNNSHQSSSSSSGGAAGWHASMHTAHAHVGDRHTSCDQELHHKSMNSNNSSSSSSGGVVPARGKLTIEISHVYATTEHNNRSPPAGNRTPPAGYNQVNTPPLSASSQHTARSTSPSLVSLGQIRMTEAVFAHGGGSQHCIYSFLIGRFHVSLLVFMYVYTYVCIYVCMYVWWAPQLISWLLLFMYVYTYVCMYVCMMGTATDFYCRRVKIPSLLMFFFLFFFIYVCVYNIHATIWYVYNTNMYL